MRSSIQVLWLLACFLMLGQFAFADPYDEPNPTRDRIGASASELQPYQLDNVTDAFNSMREGTPLTEAQRRDLALLTPDQFAAIRANPPEGFSRNDMDVIERSWRSARAPAASPTPTTAESQPPGGGGRGGGGVTPSPSPTAQTASAAPTPATSKTASKTEALKPPTVPVATTSGAVPLGTMLAGATGAATGKSEGGIFSVIASKPAQNGALTVNNGADLKGTWDNISRIINGMLTLNGSRMTVVAQTAPATGTPTSTAGPVGTAARSTAFMQSDRLVTSGGLSAKPGFDFGAASGSSPRTRFLVQEPAAVTAAAAGAGGSQGGRVRVFNGEYGDGSSESSSSTTISIRNGSGGSAQADSDQPIQGGGHRGGGN